MVEFTGDGDLFVEPVRTVGRHPNLFLYDPRPLWRLLGSGHWDLVDLHEEPFGLAVAEFMLLRWLRAPGVPFIFSSAQNIEKRYPPPFRWLEQAGSASGRRGLLVQLRGGLRSSGGKDSGASGSSCPSEWTSTGSGLRTVEPPSRDPVRRIRRSAHPPQGGRRPPQGGGARRPVPGRHLRRRPGARNGWTVMADSLGIGDRVVFHGHVDEERIPDVYPQVDVVAVPSVPLPSWIEQFGRVVVEAQASGVPVVASASGALPDVVGRCRSAGSAERPCRPPRRLEPVPRRARPVGPAASSRGWTRWPGTRGRASPPPRWRSTGRSPQARTERPTDR